MNSDNAVFQYWLDRGIRLPDPDDTGYWFSKKYFDEIQRLRNKVLRSYSLKAIGKQYKAIIDYVIRVPSV